MTFYPPKASGIDINKFGREGGLDQGIDYSSNYARAKGAVIYFSHYYSERTVSFKGFLDSFKIGLSTEVGDESNFFQGTPTLRVRKTKIEYNFVLNVPSHSVNESITNLARIQELIRYVSAGPQSANPDPISKKNVVGANASIVFVLMSNLIHNGKYTKKTSINSFKQIQEFGAMCHMSDIDFEPDVEMGFFEYSGKLLPKAFKVNVKLLVYPHIIKDGAISDKKIMRSFSATGYDPTDIQTWPFGTTYSPSTPGSSPKTYANNKTAKIGIAKAGGVSFVTFMAFLENFKFSRSKNTDIKTNAADGVDFTAQAGGDKDISYNLSFNVIANSVSEAKANAGKYQYLIRLIAKSGTTESASSIRQRLFVSNLISMPNYNPAFNQTMTDKFINENGVKGVIKSADFSPDMEMGFFEENGLFFAKAYKLTFDFKYDGIAFNKYTGGIEDKHTLWKDDRARWPFGISYTTDQKPKEVATAPAAETPPATPPTTPPEEPVLPGGLQMGGSGGGYEQSEEPAKEAAPLEQQSNNTSETQAPSPSATVTGIVSDTGGDNKDSGAEAPVTAEKTSTWWRPPQAVSVLGGEFVDLGLGYSSDVSQAIAEQSILDPRSEAQAEGESAYGAQTGGS